MQTTDQDLFSQDNVEMKNSRLLYIGSANSLDKPRFNNWGNFPPRAGQVAAIGESSVALRNVRIKFLT